MEIGAISDDALKSERGEVTSVVAAALYDKVGLSAPERAARTTHKAQVLSRHHRLAPLPPLPGRESRDEDDI